MYWKKMRVQKLGQAFLLQKGIIFDIFGGELARSSPRKIPIRISASLGRYTIFYRVCKKKMPFTWFPTNSDLKAIDSIGVFYKNKKTGKDFLGDSPLP